MVANNTIQRSTVVTLKLSRKFKMGKDSTDETSYDEKAAKVSEISHPLASKKLGKKILKVIKKGKFIF